MQCSAYNHEDSYILNIYKQNPHSTAFRYLMVYTPVQVYIQLTSLPQRVSVSQVCIVYVLLDRLYITLIIQ